jgi:transposase
MFVVESYAAVRRFVFLEGHSRREAARVFGLSRDTIAKMCRYSTPPGYVRSQGCSTLWNAEEVEEAIEAANGGAEAVLGE